jgi:hypothetical protein
MRRVPIHPDYLQSVPKNAREPYRSKGRKAKDTAREAATDSTPAPDTASAPQAALKPHITPRQHWARVIGAATLASLLVFFLAVTPGPRPIDADPTPQPDPITRSIHHAANRIHSARPVESR